MRALIMVALMMVGALAWPVLAYSAVSDPGSGLLNVDICNVPVKQAIDTIFEGRGVKYYIQPGVTGKIVELKLKGITFEEGLKSLGGAAGFTYRIEDGAYIISPAKAGTKETQAVVPTLQPSPPAQSAAQTTGELRATDQGQPSAAPVVVNNNISSPPPVFYGSGDGGGGYGVPYGSVYNVGNTGYLGGWYPILNIGTGPYVFGRFFQPPPPSGWVTPDVERFLRFNWAVPRRPGFAAPYPYYYP